jgi:poly(3-hydroxybutyrate) depolymerase
MCSVHHFTCLVRTAGLLLLLIVFVWRDQSLNAKPPTQGQQSEPTKSDKTKDDFAKSLVLRTHKVLVDQSILVTGELGQSRPATFKPTAGFRWELSLQPEKAGSNPYRVVEKGDLPVRDLAEKPMTFALNLRSVPDGKLTLVADIFDGQVKLCTLKRPLILIRGLDVAGAKCEDRLERIQGHDSTKATIRYPFDVARVVNLGKRVLGSGDFGLDSPPYAFAKGIKYSEQLLADLEGGRDPLWRAKGDHNRHYWFAEADEIMPYRVYAPTNWDGKSKLPMLVVLHGNTRDHDYYFDRDDGILGKTAQKHGWLVVTPLGYHPNGGYGAGAGGGKAKGGAGLEPWRLRRGEFSEKDAMKVAALVADEYDVDRSQIYLFGHSSGGTGTWHLGQKFAERWAGIAISAGRANAATYPFDKVKGKAIFIVHGDKDVEVPISASRSMDKALTDKGIAHEYIEFKGATHATIVALAIPKVFEFFDKHRAVGQR